MSTEMLHDQGGDWVAFRVDARYVYSSNGKLVGFCLDDQPDLVVDRNGGYLAEVVGNRLFRRTSPPFVPNAGYQADPGGASMPSNPGNVGYASLPDGMADVPRDLLG
jgi:hypothetical protein